MLMKIHILANAQAILVNILSVLKIIAMNAKNLMKNVFNVNLKKILVLRISDAKNVLKTMKLIQPLVDVNARCLV
jgi:hypothetical protein